MRSSSSPHGMTLFEALMTITIISICLLALISNSISTIVSTRDAAENAAAVRAAHMKLEEISLYDFKDIPNKYVKGVQVAGQVPPPMEFDVVLEYLPSGKNRMLPGLRDPAHPGQFVPAGEVIVVCDESKTRADYGRDLSPYDGQPDGVTFTGLPFDLNSDGDTNDGLMTQDEGLAATGRYPVGIIIRWYGAGGREERYELWTVISRY
jgi:hypothetical protein